MTKMVLHQGDCLKVLPTLPARSVDIVVTSPPYNLNTQYDEYKDNMSDEQYLDFIFRSAQAIWRVLKNDGSFFLNVAGSLSKPYMPFRIVGLLASMFKLQNVVHWIKSISIKDRTHGHFKPINSERFLHNTHEYIFHFTKSGTVPLNRLAIGVPYTDKSNIKRRGHKQDKRCRGNVWFIPYTTVQNKKDKFNHPAAFPIRLVRNCIKLHNKPRAVVLDPFAGVGNTLVAARKEKCRRAIGIELSSAYCDAISRRCKLV